MNALNARELKDAHSIRETLRIVVVGHVDHGKSTLIGRLLFDTHSLPEGAIERVKRISKEKGKPFEYAYLLDAFEEEQKQGITIDTTQIQFFTQKRDYVIIDAPGHKEFLKNMISGAASAEAAMLLIDADEGVQEQSKRHGYILSLLGIKKVYVLVNKMDLIDYSEDKYNHIQREMNQFLHSLHVYPEMFIPVSAFQGENIISYSEKMPWYDGVPVIDALDLFEKENGLEGKPLRFPIQDVYKFDDRRIIAGRIEAGTLAVGDEILISPGNKTTRVKTIEHWADRDEQKKVSAGMSVGITVEDEFFNNRGEIISHRDHPPLINNKFRANIFWLGKKELNSGKKYKLKLATEEMECTILALHKVIDASTLEIIEAPQAVKTNDVAEIIIATKQMVSFDTFSHNQNTGRFVLVDDYNVSGGGIITGLGEEAEAEAPVAEADEVSVPVKGKRLVSRKEREQKYGQKGKVILVAGHSEVKNIEIAAKLERILFDLGRRVYYLEAQADTPHNVSTFVERATLLMENGIITIVAVRQDLSEILKGMFSPEEVWIANLDQCTDLETELKELSTTA
ncbi:MAG: GTP-binding protein [Bacillota bacterium]